MKHRVFPQKIEEKLVQSLDRSASEIETFELSAREHPYIPVSTTTILSKFTRDPPPDLKGATLEQRHRNRQEQSQTVEELRRWAKYRKRGWIVRMLLRGVLWKSAKFRMPSESQLHQSVDHFFPPRMAIKCTVCDFGQGKAEKTEVCLGDIEKEFQTKPSWSKVRWIHVPLGVGLLHSSVEALFFHTGSKTMGRAFTRAGRAGWPYLECETLNLRHVEDVQDARDLLRLLKIEDGFSRTLDRGVFVGDNNQNLRKDVTWRAQYVGKTLEFLEFAESDLPWQVAEGSQLNMNGPSEGIRTMKLEQNNQSLTRHPFFKDAYLSRDPIRRFHRDDGFLLTMPSAGGVDYLNTNLKHYLQMARTDLFNDNFASSIAELALEFSETGVDTWYRQNVEWFLVYLITEVGTSPHSIRQGYSVPSIMDAYDSIVQDLKERRYDRWQRNETINLVRAYLVCIDELTVLEDIFSKKLDFFRRLKQDCDHYDHLDVLANKHPDNPEGETPSDRIAFAVHMMDDGVMQCKRLTADLRESLNSLFQLHSIEQNELAIIADTQNKAIFVFTGVTIVFLPLSFFTSYFGMNLKGIIETNRTEGYFWKVCGSSAFAILLLILLYAFRFRILEKFRLSRDARMSAV